MGKVLAGLCSSVAPAISLKYTVARRSKKESD